MTLDDALELVRIERKRQDRLWGGPVHDDTHTQRHWLGYIGSQVAKCRLAIDRIAKFPMAGTDKGMAFEERMIKVAALAIAAIESQRRIQDASTSARKPGL